MIREDLSSLDLRSGWHAMAGMGLGGGGVGLCSGGRG